MQNEIQFWETARQPAVVAAAAQRRQPRRKCLVLAR